MMPPCSLRAVCLTGLVLASIAAAGSAVRAGEVPWSADIKKAMAEAKSSGRPVLADFWAVWCAPCKTMAATTYRDSAVVEAMAGFVPLKVDKDVQTVFSERCAVEALPTALFLDAKGREIGRVSGLIGAAELVLRMRAVRDGYSAYLAARQNSEDPAALQAAGNYLLEMGNAPEAIDLLRQAVQHLADAPAEAREPAALLLAQAQLADDDLKSAIAGFEKLSASAADRAVRGRALAGLARARTAKGEEAAAEQILKQMREQYPDLVEAQTP